jgi:hypothetical protein
MNLVCACLHVCLQWTYYDSKEFEICTVDFEFESGRVSLVRA